VEIHKQIATVTKWFREFSEGRTDIHDEQRSGYRPLTFWAPAVRTIFCTLSFLSQLHELWSQTLREWCDAILLSSRVDLREFLLQFPEKGRQRSKMAYRFVRREHQSFLRRIHGTTTSHFADSYRYHKQQQFVGEFPLEVHVLHCEIVWRNAPPIWRDFGSALPFPTCLTQTKPVLPLSNEHGSQVREQSRRQCCHNKHTKFPSWPTRDVSLRSGHTVFQ